MTSNTTPDEARTALAQAISERDAVERNLIDARSAAHKASDYIDTAQYRLAELNRQLKIVEQASPDEIVCSLARDDFDIALLDKPTTEVRAKITDAQQDVTLEAHL